MIVLRAMLKHQITLLKHFFKQNSIQTILVPVPPISPLGPAGPLGPLVPAIPVGPASPVAPVPPSPPEGPGYIHNIITNILMFAHYYELPLTHALYLHLSHKAVTLWYIGWYMTMIIYKTAISYQVAHRDQSGPDHHHRQLVQQDPMVQDHHQDLLVQKHLGKDKITFMISRVMHQDTTVNC